MSKPRAFITGIAGFAGSYLAEELLEAGYEVSGGVYARESTRHLSQIRKKLTLLPLDILNPNHCERALAKTKPHYLFHLAAVASVGKSFNKELMTYRVNVEGTINMLRAAEAVLSLKKFLSVSSADCYGKFSPVNKTLVETDPFNPMSPYGIAKAAAEQICLQHHRQHGLPVIMARSFNHSGPRQSADFVIPAFASQIAAIEVGRQRPLIKVGDLSAKRDLSDVRDIVRGYRLAIEKGKPGEVYHFCSGRSVAISQVLKRLCSLSSVKIHVGVDKSRLRQADIPVLRGSNRKAAQQLGFSLRYTLKETLADTLDYWRHQV